MDQKDMINMIVELKYSINNYSQIFYRTGLEYKGLSAFVIKNTTSVFLEKDRTLVLLMSFIQLAVHQDDGQILVLDNLQVMRQVDCTRASREIN
jgi:hypothetical protein